MTSCKLLCGAVVSLVTTLGSIGSAHAQQAVLPPPAPPAPAPAAVAAPIVNGAYTCHVGELDGVEDADARTAAHVFCAELEAHHAAPGDYEVGFGRLGSHVMFSARHAASGADRHVLLQSIDEVTVAAGRLVAALAEGATVADTQNVDNVVGSESRKPKTKSNSVTVYAGLVGMTAAAIAPSASAGFDLGVGFRMGRVMLGGTFRAGGLGSGEKKLGFVGLDAGARYYLGDGDVAGFVGGGLGISYLRANGEQPASAISDDAPDGSGFGADLEMGFEFFRSSSTGAALSLRADLPFYTLKGKWTYNDSSSGYSSPSDSKRSFYAMPVSLNFGFTFR